MRKTAATVALMAVIGTPVLAADMAVKAPPAAATQSAFTWTGFYVGVDGGYSWATVGTFPPGTPAAGTASVKANGGTVGVHAGYLYQFASPFVAGLEADASWLDGNSTGLFPGVPISGMISKTRWDASIRGILGYAIDTNLIYITGGAAWINGSGCGFVTAAPGACVAGTNYGMTQTGGVVGGGLEHAFTANLIGRVEYLYADFGTKTLALAGFQPGGTASFSTKENKLRAGLSWKF
jgi:outer membrane immunogenic protein